MHANRRDLTGALGGSRILEQPRYAGEVQAYQQALTQPRVLLEVGFDHGRRLVNTARLNPSWQVIGMEVRKARVQQAAERGQVRALGNLLPWRVDARIALATVTPAASLDVVEVLFPTPWWDKKKRDKRLLLTPAFVQDVAVALKPGGVLLIATDVAGYAEQVEQVLVDCDLLEDDAQAWERRPSCTARSRREWKCEREGLEVRRFGVQRPSKSSSNAGSSVKMPSTPKSR